MARKKKETEEILRPRDKRPSGPQCGDCSLPFDFCVKGQDGRPILCRCEHRPGRLVLLSEKSCRHFEKRVTPLPESFSFGFVSC